ncbi:Uncharacterized protein FKW44_024148, partial [Caligus rogercresseyi]
SRRGAYSPATSTPSSSNGFYPLTQDEERRAANNTPQRGNLSNRSKDDEDLLSSLEELSHHSTQKWLSSHPDLSVLKMLEGLKTELPPLDDTSSGPSKPPDINSLDSATATLLQLSDPSNTFPDISTDIITESEDPFFNL